MQESLLVSHAGVTPAMPLELRNFFKNVSKLSEAIGFLDLHFGWRLNLGTPCFNNSTSCERWVPRFGTLQIWCCMPLETKLTQQYPTCVKYGLRAPVLLMSFPYPRIFPVASNARNSCTPVVLAGLALCSRIAVFISASLRLAKDLRTTQKSRDWQRFLCGTREQGDKLCWFYMLILSMIDLKSPMSHGGRTHQNDVLLAQWLIMYGKRSPGSLHPDSKFMVFGGLRFQTVIFPKKYLKPHLLMKHSCVCCSRLKFWSIRAQCFLVEPQIIFGKVPLLINISRVLIEFHSCRLGRSSPFCLFLPVLFQNSNTL